MPLRLFFRISKSQFRRHSSGWCDWAACISHLKRVSGELPRVYCLVSPMWRSYFRTEHVVARACFVMLTQNKVIYCTVRLYCKFDKRFAASWHLELDLRIFEGSLPVLLRYIDLCGRLYIVVASPGFVKSSFQSRFPTQNQSGTKHSSRPPSTSSDWVYSETLGLCLSSSYV
jgi:hypothetical protein